MQDEPMYKEIILDLNRHPLNKKALAYFDVSHREINPVCGDDISIQIKFDKEGKVVDIGHQGQGCAISQAAVSIITDHVTGLKKSAIISLGKQDVFELLGMEVIPTRLQCALLGLKAIQTAILNK